MDFDVVNPDAPYALNHPREQSRRREMLDLPHMVALSRYLDDLRREESPGHVIPDFDPCDGGTEAKALFLLDTPNRSAIASGFVSRNNLDYSSKTLCALLRRARIAREVTLIWALIPWELEEDEKPDLDRAIGLLKGLLGLLPKLRAIVLLGTEAQSAALKIGRITTAELLRTPYPIIGNSSLRDDAKRDVQEALIGIADRLI